MYFTTEFKTADDMKKLNGDYDAFACGSDVIWNTLFNAESPAFYLSFADKYKFSCAASVGLNNPREAELSLISEYVPSLDCVGVRGKNDARIVKEATGIYPELVLTPLCF